MRKTWAMELHGDHTLSTDVSHIHTHPLSHLERQMEQRVEDTEGQNRTPKANR